MRAPAHPLMPTAGTRSAKANCTCRALAVALCTLLLCACAQAPPVTVVELSPAQGPLSELLQHEIANAAKAGKAPFVELSATWCPPCKVLAASLDQLRMREAFEGTYIIRLDLDAWGEQLEPLGLKSLGVPVFFAIDGTGHATGRKIDGRAFGDDIAERMAPSLQKFFRRNGAKAAG